MKRQAVKQPTVVRDFAEFQNIKIIIRRVAAAEVPEKPVANGGELSPGLPRLSAVRLPGRCDLEIDGGTAPRQDWCDGIQDDPLHALAAGSM